MNKSLKKLILQRNSISCAGAMAILEQIEHLPLTYLDFGTNEIED